MGQDDFLQAEENKTAGLREKFNAIDAGYAARAEEGRARAAEIVGAYNEKERLRKQSWDLRFQMLNYMRRQQAAADGTAAYQNGYFASGQDPEQRALYEAMAKELGTTEAIVAADPEEFKKQLGAERMGRIAQANPRLAKFFADPDNAALTHDKVEELSSMQSAGTYLVDLVRNFVSGAVEGSAGAVLGTGKAIAHAYPTIAGAEQASYDPAAYQMDKTEWDSQLKEWQDQGKDLAEVSGIDAAHKAVKGVADAVAPEGRNYGNGVWGHILSGVQSGVRSIGAMAPGMSLGVVARGPAVPLALAGMGEGAPASLEDIEKGSNIGEAFAHGLWNAGWEILTEILPLGFMFKTRGKMNFLSRLRGSYLREVPGEVVATATQRFGDILAEYSRDPSKIPSLWKTYVLGDENHSALGWDIFDTFVSVAPMSILGTAITHRHVSQISKDTRIGLEALQDAAKKAGLSGRGREVNERLARTISTDDDGNQVITHAYVDANAFKQYYQEAEDSPSLEGACQQLEIDMQDLEAAVEGKGQHGSRVAIKWENYFTELAGTEAAYALLDDTTLNKTIPTWNETINAEEVIKERYAKNQQTFDEHAKASMDSSAAFLEAGKDRIESIEKQLRATGKYNEEDIPEAAETIYRQTVSFRLNAKIHDLTFQGKEVTPDMIGQLTEEVLKDMQPYDLRIGSVINPGATMLVARNQRVNVPYLLKQIRSKSVPTARQAIGHSVNDFIRSKGSLKSTPALEKMVKDGIIPADIVSKNGTLTLEDLAKSGEFAGYGLKEAKDIAKAITSEHKEGRRLFDKTKYDEGKHQIAQYAAWLEGDLQEAGIDINELTDEEILDRLAEFNEVRYGNNEEFRSALEAAQADGTFEQRGFLAEDETPEARAEANRQYDEVVAKYKGTDQWMKAPNGADTKLSEREWVRARTKNFKDFFGDWEAEGNLARQPNKPDVPTLFQGAAENALLLDENGEPLAGIVDNGSALTLFQREAPTWLQEGYGDGTALARYLEEHPEKAEAIKKIQEFISLENQADVAVENQAPSQRDYQVATNKTLKDLMQDAGLDLQDMNDPVVGDLLVGAVVTDADMAMKYVPDAIGWYNEKVREALAYAGAMFPELDRNGADYDREKEFAFIYALAVTSNGNTVEDNAKLAVAAYEAYRKTGQFALVGTGTTAKAINDSLKAFPDIASMFRDVSEFRKYMMTRWTVQQIDLMFGRGVFGELSSEMARGALILGPKIGNGFFANLYGAFEALTMDRWFMRTFGRWNGGLIQENPELFESHKERLRKAIEATRQTPGYEKFRDEFKSIFGFDIDFEGPEDELFDMIIKANRKFGSEGKARKRMDTDYAANGSKELRLSIKAVAEDIANNEKIAPASGTERQYIRAIFRKALARLQEKGGKFENIVMADLQALLWYAEKRLYDSTKPNKGRLSPYDLGETPDYATAMRGQAKERLGLDNDQLDAIRQGVLDDIKEDTGEKRYESFDGKERSRVFGEVSFEGIRRRIQAEGGSEGSGTLADSCYIESRAGSLEGGSTNESGADDGGSGRDGQNAGILAYPKKSFAGKELEVVAELKCGSRLKNILKTKEAFSGEDGAETAGATVFELRNTPEAVAAFRDAALKYGKDLSVNKYGACVTMMTDEELANARIFLSADGKAGFVIKNGDEIGNLFAAPDSGGGHSMVEAAKTAGGRRLDCFNTVLPAFYAMHGFFPVAKTKFDVEYAPEDWNAETYSKYNNGQPDIIHMVLAENNARHAGWLEEALAKLSYVEYEEGARIQQDSLRSGEIATANRKLDALLAKASALEQARKSKAKKPKAKKSAAPAVAADELYQDTEARSRGPDGPGGRALGALTIRTDSSMFISLFENSDITTIFHESAHFMIESIGNDVRTGRANRWMQDQYKVICDWLGADPDSRLTREQHEKFAEAWENYLMEGKAPAISLRGIFKKLKEWFVSVYKQGRRQLPEHAIPKEVRDVFDRMIALETEIEFTKNQEALLSEMPDAEELGITEEEMRDYRRACDEDIEEAQGRIRNRLFRAKRRAKNKQYQEDQERFQKDAEQEWDENPMVQLVEGAIASDDPLGKFNRASVVSLIGEEDAAQLPDGLLDDAGGIFPDEAAEEYGIDTAQELMQQIWAMPSREDFIRDRTQQLLDEKYGDTLTDAAIQQEVEEAMAGDAAEERLARELAVIERAREKQDGREKAEARHAKEVEKLKAKIEQERVAGRWDVATVRAKSKERLEALEKKHRQEMEDLRKKVAGARQERVDANAKIKAIRERKAMMQKVAEGIIYDMPVNMISPSDCLRQMRTASAQARRAMLAKKPNYERVVELKEKELFQFQMYRAALDARKRLDSGRNAARKILRMPQKKAAKGRTMNYVYQAKAWAARLLGSDPAVWDEKLKGENKYNEDILHIVRAQQIDVLTYGDAARQLGDLQALWSLSLRDNKIKVGEKLVDIKKAEEELAAVMQNFGVSWRPRNERDGAKDRFMRFAGSLATSMTRMESWCDMVDGNEVGKETGPFTKYIFQPIKQAADRARMKQVRYMSELGVLLQKFQIGPGTIEAEELGGHVFGQNTGYAKAEIIHALLHTGNKSNLERLIIGFGWGEYTNKEKTEFDTSNWEAFVNRMIAEGVITKKDMDTVQEIWDLFDKLKPGMQKANKEVFGQYFDEIPPEPISMFGTEYKGGYVPAIYDPRSEVGQRQELDPETAKNAMRGDGAGMFLGKLQAGWSNTRVKGVPGPLHLKLDRLGGHLNQQILFSEMAPASMDVAKVLQRKSVQAAFRNYDPNFYSEVVVPWFSRAITQNISGKTGQQRTEEERLLQKIRNRAGLAVMFGNFVNAAEGFFDLSAVTSKVNTPHLRHAFGQMATNRKQTLEQVMGASIFMRDRLTNESNAARNRIEQALRPSRLAKVGNWVGDHAYFLQEMVDGFTAPVAWLGAYNQAVEGGLDHDTAVAQADSVVRQCYGTNNAEDLANREAGGIWKRLFTQFTGYFVQRANLIAGEGNKRVRNSKTRAAMVLALSILSLQSLLLPAWISGLLRKAAAGQGMPDDDDWWAWMLDVFGWTTANYVVGMVNVTWPGKMANAAIETATSDRMASGRIFSSPMIKPMEDVMKFGQFFYHKDGHIDWDRGLRWNKVISFGQGANNLIPFLPIIPNRVLASGKYAYGAATGDIKPEGAYDFVRGAVTGMASPGTRTEEIEREQKRKEREARNAERESRIQFGEMSGGGRRTSRSDAFPSLLGGGSGQRAQAQFPTF